jgi:hypothetical protein
VKEWVLTCLLGRHSLSRIVGQETIKHIQTIIVEFWYKSSAPVAVPLGERGLVVGKAFNARPGLFVGSAEESTLVSVEL